MRYLNVLIGALTVLGLISCDAGNPTSSRTRNSSADLAAKLTISARRTGGYNADGAVTASVQQGAFYAVYLGAVAGPFTRLGSVDTQTGVVTERVDDFGEGYNAIPALIASGAFDLDGTFYTLINTLNVGGATPSCQLAIVDIYSGQIYKVGQPNPFHMTAMEIDDRGQIYAAGYYAPNNAAFAGDSYLYRIDRRTGAATRIGDTGLEEVMDLAFDSAGTLYATTDNILYTFDLDSGQILSEVAIGGVPEQTVTGGACGDVPCVRSPFDSEFFVEVMSIGFDENDVLYAMPMVAFHRPVLELDGQPHGAPLMQIDPVTGDATVVAWTGQPNFHGGDFPPSPSRVDVCHRKGGRYGTIEIASSALPAHLNHGDILPGPDGRCGSAGDLLQEAIYAPYLGLDPAQAFMRLGAVDTRTGDVRQLVNDFGAEYDLPVIIASAAFDVDGTLYTFINTLDFRGFDPDFPFPAPIHQLAIIDPHRGQIIPKGEIIPVDGTNSFHLTAMEIDACGQIYAAGFDLADFGFIGNTNLYTVDKETGLATLIGDTGIVRIMDLAFDSAGALYATTANDLYTLDTVTGQASVPMPIHGVPKQWVTGPVCGVTPCEEQSEVMSIAFDKHGVLYALSMIAGDDRPLLEVDGQPHGAPLLEIDPGTGNATLVAWTGELNFHGGDIPSANGSLCDQ
jgi:hypothetical protein